MGTFPSLPLKTRQRQVLLKDKKGLAWNCGGKEKAYILPWLGKFWLYFLPSPTGVNPQDQTFSKLSWKADFVHYQHKTIEFLHSDLTFILFLTHQSLTHCLQFSNLCHHPSLSLWPCLPFSSIQNSLFIPHWDPLPSRPSIHSSFPYGGLPWPSIIELYSLSLCFHSARKNPLWDNYHWDNSVYVHNYLITARFLQGCQHQEGGSVEFCSCFYL